MGYLVGGGLSLYNVLLGGMKDNSPLICLFANKLEGLLSYSVQFFFRGVSTVTFFVYVFTLRHI